MGEVEAKLVLFHHNVVVFFKENMLSCSLYSGCNLTSLLKLSVDGGRQQHDLLDLSTAGMGYRHVADKQIIRASQVDPTQFSFKAMNPGD